MLATLALTSALTLAPAQSGTLQLKNDRPTFGILGQERKDSKLLPGELFIVAFDIEGLKVAPDGRVQYSMGMELTNKEGKVAFKKDPENLEAYNALGGDRLPAFARVEVGTETPDGEYTLKVTVKDLAAGKSETLVRKFEVAGKKFGFVRLGFAYESGLPAPPIAAVGQTYFANFAVVGFDLDKSRKDQPNIETSLRVLDEAGKPTLEKPFVGAAMEVSNDFKKIIPMQFVLQLNRPGKFKIELKATDKLTGKSVVDQSLDFTVVEPK